MKVYDYVEVIGYTSDFKIYMKQDRSEVSASMKVVFDLTHEAGLFEEGYQLYLDNWYSSLTLSPENRGCWHCEAK